MVFKAHIFYTSGDAKEAVSIINAGEGYPKDNANTTSYTKYYEHEDYYIIHADEVTRKYCENEDEILVQEITE